MLMPRDGQNQVYPILRQGGAAVEKHFASLEGWRNEYRLYAALAGKLPLPEILEAAPRRLVLSYCGAPTMLAERRRQEVQGFDPAPWQALAQWLRTCRNVCGELPDRMDLGNFLWDPAKGQIIGLGLEGFRPAGRGSLSLADLPGDTCETAVGGPAILARELGALPGPDVRAPEEPGAGWAGRISGVILAGGASSRMGVNKAELRLRGGTLLQIQIEKMRALGITDIMLSGETCPRLPGVRVVPDVLPGNGPLGGLHACLQAARHEACLVLSVDVPLLPSAALAYLCRAHRGGATLLGHGQLEEPLVAVYDAHLAAGIPGLIQEGRRSARALAPPHLRNIFAYRGPGELLENCNTPGEFSEASRLFRAYAGAGISLITFGLP